MAHQPGSRVSRAPLRRGQLVGISVYWLAINALWGLMPIVQPYLVTRYVCGTLSDAACAAAGAALHPAFGSTIITPATANAFVGAAGVTMAILIQPLMGAISDYTVTRWGRRTPYLVIGTLLDVVFLVGLAMSSSFVALMAFVVLIQFSSNFAQGPFQGYVPDLVPAEQVGVASSAMGVMIIVGQLAGVAAGAVSIALGAIPLGFAAVAILELATMTITVLTVHEPADLVPPVRTGRLAAEVSGAIREVRGEHNFLWFLCSRLFILTATGMLVGQAFFFLTRTLALTHDQAGVTYFVAFGIISIATVVAAAPAGRLSDRLGRKRVISIACGLGFVGMAAFAVAPAAPAFVITSGVILPLALIALVPVGASNGLFLAVDWALMTDIIPKRTAGRYMGLSNVVTGTSGTIAAVVGGIIIDRLDAVAFGTGPRAAMLLGASCFLVGLALLRRVNERRVEGGDDLGRDLVPEPAA